MSRLYSRYTLLVTFGAQALRFGVLAIAVTGGTVLVLRALGVPPAEIRLRLPLVATVAVAVAAGLAAVATWRRLRHRHSYRSRYRRYS